MLTMRAMWSLAPKGGSIFATKCSRHGILTSLILTLLNSRECTSEQSLRFVSSTLAVNQNRDSLTVSFILLCSMVFHIYVFGSSQVILSIPH